MTDADELSRHYAILPEERLVELVMFEAEDLQPQARQILKAEIQRRGLPGDLVEGVEIHERGLPADQRQQLIAWLRQQTCPVCGRTGKILNGILLVGTLSFYFVLNWTGSHLFIACGECLRRQADELRDPLLNEAAKQPEPTEALLDFVDNNAVPLFLRMKAGQSAFEEYDPHLGKV